MRHRLERNSAVVYAYCDFKERSTHSASILVAALTRQILELDTRTDALERLEGLQSEARHSHRALSEQEILAVFSKSMQSFDRVYIIIDGLDELPETPRDEFVSQLRELDAYVMITSRYNVDPVMHFETTRQLDISATYEDCKRYMKREINKCSRLKKFIAQDHLLEGEILRGVESMAQGIFLLAGLQIRSLGKESSVGNVRRALEKSIAWVHDQYKESMERIRCQDENDAKLALKLLALVFCATRPLTIEEITHALAIEPGENFDEERCPDIEVVLAASIGLVEVVSSKKRTSAEGETMVQTIRLVHYTLEQFFLEEGIFPTVQMDLTRDCLAYLSYTNIRNRLLHDATDSSGDDCPPFADYALLNWGIHAQPVQRDMIDQISNFLNHDFSPNMKRLFWRLRNPGKKLISEEAFKSTSPLIVATALGLHHVLEEMLEQHDVNTPDCHGHTPLHLAAYHGHHEVTEHLLRAGADVEVRNLQGYTAIEYARLNGQRNVETLLLGASADQASVYHDVDVAECGASEALPSGTNGLGQETVLKPSFHAPEVYIKAQIARSWST